jgi:hypothetical protein
MDDRRFDVAPPRAGGQRDPTEAWLHSTTPVRFSSPMNSAST